MLKYCNQNFATNINSNCAKSDNDSLQNIREYGQKIFVTLPDFGY